MDNLRKIGRHDTSTQNTRKESSQCCQKLSCLQREGLVLKSVLPNGKRFFFSRCLSALKRTTETGIEDSPNTFIGKFEGSLNTPPSEANHRS